MCKHSADVEVNRNAIKALASKEGHALKSSRKEQAWIITLTVSAGIYITGSTEYLPFGFAVQHVIELVLTSGVVKALGE